MAIYGSTANRYQCIIYVGIDMYAVQKVGVATTHYLDFSS